MRITGTLGQGTVREMIDAIGLARQVGVERIWTGDASHDPFLPLAMVARDAPEIAIGTSVAIAYARTPWSTALAAWDLNQLSNGQFVLGLGSQVKAHVERRYGRSWRPAASYMRDYVLALKAIFAHFNGERLRYEGEHLKLTLSSPQFRPEQPGLVPQIYMGGVNSRMCRVAGEVADGFIVHGFNSAPYIRERVVPELTGDRDRGDLTVVAPVLIAASDDPEQAKRLREDARRTVAYYASTPAYRTQLEAHGLEGLGERLSPLAREQRWAEMTELIDDDVLDLYAVCGTTVEAGREVHHRYSPLADEVFFIHGIKDTTPEWWAGVLHGIREADGAS